MYPSHRQHTYLKRYYSFLKIVWVLEKLSNENVENRSKLKYKKKLSFLQFKRLNFIILLRHK